MKKVPGFPAYQVDESGAISRNGRRLNGSPNTNGYIRVSLCADGKRHSRYAHRIVCEAFHGEACGREVRHLNNDRQDNRPENLAWGTRQENVDDMVVHGTVMTGERRHNAVLTADAVLKMRGMAANGASMQEAASAFGVTPHAAANAITGRRWGHIAGALGSYVTRRKFTDEQVRSIRSECASATQSAVAEKYGVTRTAVQAIALRKSYGHVQ